MDSDDVLSAAFTKFQPEEKELSITLTERGGRKFAEATAKNVGRQLAIVWNGRVISAPIVQTAITSRNANIVGAFTDAEARELLDLLNHRAAAAAVSTNSAEASSPATGSAPSHGPPFVARLAQGEIELLALSRHPSDQSAVVAARRNRLD